MVLAEASIAAIFHVGCDCPIAICLEWDDVNCRLCIVICLLTSGIVQGQKWARQIGISCSLFCSAHVRSSLKKNDALLTDVGASLAQIPARTTESLPVALGDTPTVATSVLASLKIGQAALAGWCRRTASILAATMVSSSRCGYGSSSSRTTGLECSYMGRGQTRVAIGCS